MKVLERPNDMNAQIFQRWKDFVANIASKVVSDDLLTQSAATSFYLALSLAPFLLILLASLSLLSPELQDDLVIQVAVLVGERASEAIAGIIDHMKSAEKGSLSVLNLLSLGTLLFAASAVFAQMKQSLDVIFQQPSSPPTEAADESLLGMAWSVVKQRILTIGVVLTFIVLSVLSLAVSGYVGLVVNQFNTFGAKTVDLLNNLISLAVFSVFFALIFRWVPQRRISWSSAFRAGFATAFLFMVGKVLIGFYLSSAAMTSFYGAAGSFLALLIWVYYSSMIIFFGAEIANEIQNEDEKNARAR